MRVIVISGKARHGKDTTGELLREALEADGHRVLVTHYADLVKYVCKQFFGWDGVKDEKGRSILQYVGTDVVRKQAPDFWVWFVSSILKLFYDNWDFVLIPDCRFPNEIQYLKSEGFDVTHLRVVREDFDNGLTEEQKRHPSETALDDIEPDAYIMNDGTMKDLRRAVSDWVTDHTGIHQMTFDDL